MLKLEDVSFAYENGEQVLENISFTAKRGENISIIGESGCGKSTLLQIIYGLLHTDGKVFWGEQELLGPNFNLVAGEDFIKYLAQDFDLMLPLSVADNVGKYLSNMYPVKKKKRIQELLEVVEMEDMANKKTKFLSGGQQQRVALARALAKEPEMVLLDEPFSHIDHFRKNNLRRKVFKYLKDQNITCIIATHDITDALAFADTTMVLKDHNIYAKATPEDLYNNPPNKYVASLFGDVNEVVLKDIVQNETSTKKIILYPEELKVSRKSPIKATVIASYFKGSTYLIEADLNGKTVFAEHRSAIPSGAHVYFVISKPLIEKRKI